MAHWLHAGEVHRGVFEGCQFATSHTSMTHFAGETVRVWGCHGTGTQEVSFPSWPQYLYLPRQSKASQSGQGIPSTGRGRAKSAESELQESCTA